MASSFLICFSLLAMEPMDLNFYAWLLCDLWQFLFWFPAPFQVFLAGFTIAGLGWWSLFPFGGGEFFDPWSLEGLRLCLLRLQRTEPAAGSAEFPAATGVQGLSGAVHHRWDCWRPCGMKLMDVTQHGYNMLWWVRRPVLSFQQGYNNKTKNCAVNFVFRHLLWQAIVPQPYNCITFRHICHCQKSAYISVYMYKLYYMDIDIPTLRKSHQSIK